MERKKRLYIYVLRSDDGAASNPFYGVCTLAICKPGIRATAKAGDWIIGTGSKNSQLAKKDYHDLSTCVVYAMKVTERMTLEEYDNYCHHHLPGKIPKWQSLELNERMGDCIYYDFKGPGQARMRDSVHKNRYEELNNKRDLKGKNVLLSNHFYYFGFAAKALPPSLHFIIKRNQGHKIFDQENVVSEFESWISGFELNKLYTMPQLSWQSVDGSQYCGEGCSPTTASVKSVNADCMLKEAISLED